MSKVRRIKTVDRSLGVVRKRRQERLDADRVRDMVDEVDEDGEADHREHDANGDGEVGHEARTLDTFDGSQNKKAIDESADEGTQDHLVAAIAHEVAQHAGPELGRGELQGQHGDRERQSGDRDHRTRDGGKNSPGAFGPEQIKKLHASIRLVFHGSIQPGHDEGQDRRTGGHDARQEPEAAAQMFPDSGDRRH